MVTQSITSDAVSFFAGNTSQSSTKVSDKGFSQVMDKSLNNSGNEKSGDKEVSNEAKEITTKTNEKTPVNLDKTQETTEQAKVTTENTEPTEDEIVIKEEDLLKMEQLIAQLGIKISDVVKQVMNVSDEELTSALESLGLELNDLLQPDNLKQLVLTLHGTEDITQLLTNETLAQEFTQLKEAFEGMDLEKELGITKEQLASIMDMVAQMPVVQNTMNTEQAANQQSDTKLNMVDTETEPAIEVKVETTQSASQNSVKPEISDSARNSEQPQDDKTANTNLVDSFIQNLAGVTAENVDQLSDQAFKLNQMKEIVSQVVEKIKVLIKPDSTSMEIQLNPENLGKVNLSVVAKNGILTATFVAENQLAKEAIENQLHTLKENLNNQGVKVEAIEVTVSNFAFQQSTQTDSGSKQQKGASKRAINLNEFDYTDEDNSDEELLAARVLEQSGGSVDYTA